MHNPRIGRFFSVDPLAPKYPHNSPYAFSENIVIHAVELEGLEAEIVVYSPELQCKLQNLDSEEVKEILRVAYYAVNNEFVDDDGNKSDYVQRKIYPNLKLPENGKAASFKSDESNMLNIYGVNTKGKKYLLHSITLEAKENSNSWWDSIMNYFETFTDTNSGKTRNATSFEVWISENVSQSELNNLADAFGDNIGALADNEKGSIDDLRGLGWFKGESKHDEGSDPINPNDTMYMKDQFGHYDKVLKRKDGAYNPVGRINNKKDTIKYKPIKKEKKWWK